MKTNLKILVLLFFANFGLLFAQKTISLSQFPDDKVMVVAHRGDWREAPENSVWAIKKAIEKGVNMAEVDLAMTKDSILILMHDKTIDRTTNGKGKPEDFTYAELQKLFLRDGIGHVTEMKIPTLEEILEISNNKIFLNLDKGFDYIALVYPMLKKRKMLDQVLFKGTPTYKDFNRKFGHLKNDIHFMPIIRLSESEGWLKIKEYTDNYKVYGFEFTVGLDESKMLDFQKVREQKVKVWINSLWPYHNAKHDDDKALENPNIYDWYIKNNINIIQTDRPKELIQYLKERRLFYGL